MVLRSCIELAMVHGIGGWMGIVGTHRMTSEEHQRLR